MKIKFIKLKNITNIYIVIFLVLFSFSLIMFFKQYMFFYEGDVMGRLIFSETLFTRNLKYNIEYYSFVSGIWLPFFHLMENFILLFFSNPVEIIYEVILILSIMTVIIFYFLIKKLFKKKIAIVSSILLISFPIFLGFSLQAMTEIPFLFFLFLSFYFFLDIKKNKNFIWFSISYFIASMTRHEAWIFIPLFIIFLPKKISKLKKYIFVLIILLYPTFLFLINFYYHQDLLRIPTVIQTAMIKIDNCVIDFSNTSQFLFLFYNSFPMMEFIFGIIGLLIFIKKNLNFDNKKYLFYPILFFYSLIIISFSSTACLLKAEIGFSERHLLIPMTLFIPFVAYLIIEIYSFLNKKIHNIQSSILTIFLIFLFVYFSLVLAIDFFKGDSDAKNVANWLVGKVSKNEKIILDIQFDYIGRGQLFLIFAESRLLPRQIILLGKWKERILNTSDVLVELGKYNGIIKYYTFNITNVKYVVHNKNSVHLNLSSYENLTIQNITFFKLKKFGDFYIFMKP